MSSKKKKGKRAYLDDFKEGESGKYAYTGKTYEYAESTPRRPFLTRASILCFACVLCTIVGGCIPAAGTGSAFYLILPYVGEIGAVGSVVWALIELFAAKNVIRGYVFDKTVAALPSRCIVLTVFALVSAAAEILFLILNGFDENLAASVIYILLKIIVAACSLILRARVVSTEFVRTDGGE